MHVIPSYLKMLLKGFFVSNPLTITIPEETIGATASGGLSCVANADFKQRVDVEVTDSNGAKIEGQFKGSGNGTSMTLSDGKKHLNFSELEAPIDVKMQFSYDSGSGYQDNRSNEVFEKIDFNNSKVKAYTVRTEDSVDNDNNDTYLTLVALMHN
ncbi:MAG: hypothetical protein ACR2RF_17755 [Geminicoccaceae bacterium]